MLHQVIKFSDGLLSYKSADKRHSQASRNQKSQEGSQGESHRRVKKSREGPKKTSSDDPGNFPRDGGNDNLQDLQCNEYQGSVEAKGSYKGVDSPSARKKTNDLPKPFMSFPIII